MSATIYDRLSRSLIRAQPAAVLAWLLGVLLGGLRFVRWLDAHLGSPEAAERTADALAHVADEADGGRPWLLLVESQTRPDAEMYGRALEYLGGAWRRERPSELPGDRFAVAAIIINLTGVGHTFEAVSWAGAGLRSGESGRDVNLGARDAGAVLDQVARGEAPAVVLAWIPLMQRGDDPGIIERWKGLAEKVTDRRVRAALAGVTVFAELTGCRPLWEQALMEAYPWTESPFINECIDKALKVRLAPFENKLTEVEKRAAEAEKHVAEVEKRAAEAEKQKAEAEKQRAEAGERLEEARKRAEAAEQAARAARKEGQVEGKVRAVIGLLTVRLGPIPQVDDLARSLTAAGQGDDPARLDAILELAVSASSLDEFRRDARV